MFEFLKRQNGTETEKRERREREAKKIVEDMHEAATRVHYLEMSAIVMRRQVEGPQQSHTKKGE